jgi:hypothetical protein
VLTTLAILAGLAAAGAGLIAAATWLTTAMTGAPDDDLTGVVALFALAVLGVGLGLPLALAGMRARRGYPARLPGGLPIWLWLPLTLLAVAAGAAVIAARLNLAATLPVLHLFAIGLPAVGAISLAARPLAHAAISDRRVLGHVASGAYLATTLALVLELIVGLIVGGAALIVVMLIPGGADQVRRALDLLVALAQGGEVDTAELVRIAVWPPFALLALAFVSGLAPLIEEAVKPISAFLLADSTPSAGAAFLSGVAAGAGFALTEGLLNGAGSLDEWPVTALLRAGGSAMHAFASGLVAWGWFRSRQSRRAWPALLHYGIALALHATWNVIALGGGLAFALLTAEGASQSEQVAGSVVALVLFGLLAVLTFVAFAGIVYVSRRLANKKTSEVSETSEV